MRQSFNILLKQAYFLAVLVSQCHSVVVNSDRKVEGGEFRYFYDDGEGVASCLNVVLFGVGTAMSIKDYNIISTDMVSGRDIVAIVVDPAPGFPTKNSDARFVQVIDAIVTDLHTFIPICNIAPTCSSSTNSTDPDVCTKKIIIGGHSASGGTAWRCLSKLSFRPSGYLGLDPYRLDPKAPEQVDIPTLSFGFTRATCGVEVDFAAKASYLTSGNDHRVLYMFDNQVVEGNGASKILHCSFTDKGCFGVICPGGGDGDAWVRASVGFSLQAFFSSLMSQVFQKEDYFLPTNDANLVANLYVNGDTFEQISDRVNRGIFQVPKLNVAMA